MRPELAPPEIWKSAQGAVAQAPDRYSGAQHGGNTGKRTHERLAAGLESGRTRVARARARRPGRPGRSRSPGRLGSATAGPVARSIGLAGATARAGAVAAPGAGLGPDPGPVAGWAASGRPPPPVLGPAR